MIESCYDTLSSTNPFRVKNNYFAPYSKLGYSRVGLVRLTSPNSMGAYLTCSPSPEQTDSVAIRLINYLEQARTEARSATNLKDGTESNKIS